ncbi:MAG: hypothetical protein ABH823_05650, partial [bacterium]
MKKVVVGLSILLLSFFAYSCGSSDSTGGATTTTTSDGATTTSSTVTTTTTAPTSVDAVLSGMTFVSFEAFPVNLDVYFTMEGLAERLTEISLGQQALITPYMTHLGSNHC